MGIVGIIITVAAYLLLDYIANNVQSNKIEKQRLKNIEHLRKMARQYPDAYKEWYGSTSNLNSLDWVEISKRAEKSLSSWQAKQHEIEAAREKAQGGRT